jgi:hypothetical protein
MMRLNALICPPAITRFLIDDGFMEPRPVPIPASYAYHPEQFPVTFPFMITRNGELLRNIPNHRRLPTLCTTSLEWLRQFNCWIRFEAKDGKKLHLSSLSGRFPMKPPLINSLVARQQQVEDDSCALIASRSRSSPSSAK